MQSKIEKIKNNIIKHLVYNIPLSSFSKTVRGVKYSKLEFIFSTDREVVEDNQIVVKGKELHYIVDESIRQKLLYIYDSI